MHTGLSIAWLKHLFHHPFASLPFFYNFHTFPPPSLLHIICIEPSIVAPDCIPLHPILSASSTSVKHEDTPCVISA
ncbi:hypothetical protein CGMCC3_g15588 [Colletotrichum fructicola]|nr:uncharacterized protein CGMCC3_g15588 [Colletotrichum fructicola]KAE9568265.1 hypothetical protein CGMCC3_g15588 [Colletotrichum fructicola]